MDLNITVMGVTTIVVVTTWCVFLLYAYFFTGRKAYELHCSLIDFAYHDYRVSGERVIWMNAQTSFMEMSSLKNAFKNPEKMIVGKYAQEFFVWRENPVEIRREIKTDGPDLRIIH